MSDVLTVTVPLSTGSYPTKNREGKDGFRGGRKSDAYREVFNAVETAARAEMERIGWTIADCECAGFIMRVMPNRWKADALNIGTAEANALTAAGVWTDDQACSPAIKYVRYDGEGAHRVVIVVVKLHQPVATVVKSIAPKTPRVREATSAPVAPLTPGNDEWRAGDAIPDGKALLGGKLIDRSEALNMIRGTK